MSEQDLKKIDQSNMSTVEKNIIKTVMESLMQKRFESMSIDDLVELTLKLSWNDGFRIARDVLEGKRLKEIKSMDVNQLKNEYNKVLQEKKVMDRRTDYDGYNGIRGDDWMNPYIRKIKSEMTEKGYFTDVIDGKLKVVKENTLNAHQELIVYPYEKVRIGNIDSRSGECIYNNYRFDSKYFPGKYPKKGEYKRSDIAMERYLNVINRYGSSCCGAVLRLENDVYEAFNPHGQCGYGYMSGKGLRRWDLLHGQNSKSEYVTVLSYFKLYNNSRPCGFSLNIKGDVSEKDIREIRKIMIENGYAASDLQEKESENIINDILNYLNDKK